MEYRSMWEWLGIAPTTDLIAIKRAFAEKSKEYHPEEHPQEFQALQKAYHAAAAYAKANKARNKEPGSPGENAAGSGVQPSMEFVVRDSHPRDLTRETKETRGTERESEETRKTEREPEKSQDLEEIKMEGNFSYDDIADAFRQDRFERFLSEFSAIMYHSKLRNNIFCWKYFFGQEKYQNYLKEVDTWNRIVALVKNIDRWRRDTIFYFEECRDRYLKNTTAKGNIPRFPGSVKRFRTKTYCGQCTVRELELHRYLLKQISCQEADLKRFEYIAAYLELYLPYAAAQPREVYDFYDSIKVKRRVGIVLTGIAILSVWIVLVLIDAGFFGEFGENTQNDFTQQRIDNLKKSLEENNSEEIQFRDRDQERIDKIIEERQERIDKIMEDASRRYDVWEDEMAEGETESEQTDSTEL